MLLGSIGQGEAPTFDHHEPGGLEGGEQNPAPLAFVDATRASSFAINCSVNVVEAVEEGAGQVWTSIV